MGNVLTTTTPGTPTARWSVARDHRQPAERDLVPLGVAVRGRGPVRQRLDLDQPAAAAPPRGPAPPSTAPTRSPACRARRRRCAWRSTAAARCSAPPTPPAAPARGRARPSIAQSSLNAVSCASASLCVAVDDSGNVLVSTTPGSAPSSGWTAGRRRRRRGAGLGVVRAHRPVRRGRRRRQRRCSPPTPPGAHRRGRVTARSGAAALDGMSCPSASFCAGADAGGDVVTSTSPGRQRRRGRRRALQSGVGVALTGSPARRPASATPWTPTATCCARPRPASARPGGRRRPSTAATG